MRPAFGLLVIADTPATRLADAAYSVLACATDLDDAGVIEIARRVIDAQALGIRPRQSDLAIILRYFN
jgi:hypothetical protein